MLRLSSAAAIACCVHMCASRCQWVQCPRSFLNVARSVLRGCRHPQGTEVKAITYSNMQIHEKEFCSDLYVIVDI
eukprot:12008-Eustigmatos_ZCMA.PRE.1